MKKNKKISRTKKAMLGVGVAMASAGAYYFLGPKGKAHQKKALVLMAKMKREVMQKTAKAKSITVPLYHKTVDTLASTYAKQNKAHGKDIQAFAKKLKSEWKSVAKKVTKKPTANKKKT